MRQKIGKISSKVVPKVVAKVALKEVGGEPWPPRPPLARATVVEPVMKRGLQTSNTLSIYRYIWSDIH